MEDLFVYFNQGVFAVCACLGAVTHFVKKAARGETDTTLHEWFGVVNVKSTFFTLIVLLFVVIGALFGDIITPQTDFWASLYIGFVTGFAVDSAFNSDRVPQTTTSSEGKIQVVIRRKIP